MSNLVEILKKEIADLELKLLTLKELLKKHEAENNVVTNSVSQPASTYETIQSSIGGGNANKSHADTPSSYIGFKDDWTVGKKIIFILKTEGRFLHSSQITKIVNKHSSKDIKISPFLSVLKKSESIAKYTVGNQNRNTFWGHPKWLDDNGEIIPGREYDKDMLSHGSSTIKW